MNPIVFLVTIAGPILGAFGYFLSLLAVPMIVIACSGHRDHVFR